MSLLAEFEVPPDEVALAATLRELPAAAVEFERQVPTADGPLPHLWMRGAARSAFESHAAGDPTVDSLVHIGELDGDHVYRVVLRDPGPFVRGLRADAAILRMEGTAGGWHCSLRFDSQSALEYFRAYCERHDLRFGLTRLADGTSRSVDNHGVTAAQREALSIALERGYFEVPRGCTMAEIAEDLGVSTRAASERLRRGHANLVGGVLS